MDPVPGWGGTFRFCNESHISGEEIYAFPDDVFARFKTDTFYIDVTNYIKDATNIRVTTGWWDATWRENEYNAAQELVDNKDGTWTLEINFSDYSIADLIEEHHLLFTGSDYTIMNIYFSGGPGPGPEPPVPVKEVFWENPDPGGLGPVNWDGVYRFGLDGTDGKNECIATFSQDIWDRIKYGTFFINFAGSDWIQMRITTGWWSTTWTGADITTGDERLILNEDGTYTLEINFTGDPIVELLDQQHLLFTGGGYTPLSLYLINEPEVPYRVLWDNDHTFKDPSWGGGYRFGFVEGPFTDNCVALFSKEDWDNVIKGGTFYLDIEDYDNDDYFQIHITDGSWSVTWGDDIYPYSSPYLIKNMDGTWTLEITLGDGEFIDAIDANNLLFTGAGYSITRLYCGSKDPFAKQRIWTNPYPKWTEDKSFHYRFASESYATGEEIYVFPNEIWEKIKSQHFYLDLEAKEDFSIRVTTGWWDTTWTGDVIRAGSDYLTDNGDGTWTLEIYFGDDPIIYSLDYYHLLFDGENYRPLGLRLGVDRSYMSSVNVFKRESTSFKNKAYITTTNDVAWKDTEITLTVGFKDETNKFPYELEVTYNDGLRTCELTQVDEDTYTFIMPNFDVDITAYFDIDHVVKFDWQGHGIQPESQILHEGNKVTMPPWQTFDQNFVFLGWYQENSCTTVPWDFKNDVIKGDITLFARWEIFVSAEIKSAPTKTEYLCGEDLDLSGGKITVHSKQQYSQVDFTTDIDITPEMISGYDKYKLGEQVVTINYGNITSTFTVTVTDYISNIAMKSNPTKVTYKYGEDLDLAGAKISINMASGAISDIDITSSMVSGYDKNKLGEQTLTVTYEGLTTTFNVNVIDYASSITIKSNPTKTEFYRGEDLDLTGAKITVKMASGATSDVDVIADMVSGYDKNKLGEQVITITYQGQTTTFTITVISASLSNGVIITISVGGALVLVALILLITYLINRKKNLDLLNSLFPNGVTCIKTQSLDDRLDEYVFTYFYKGRQMSYYLYKQKKLHLSEAQAKEQFKKLILNGKVRRYSNKYRNDIKRLGC